MTSFREPMSDELISAYLDGELSGDERAQVEQLILSEPRYRQQLESLRALRDSLQQLPRHVADDRFAERVLSRINEHRSLQATDAAAAHLSKGAQLDRRDRSIRPGLRRGVLWSLATVAAAVLIAIVMPSRDLQQVGQVPAPAAPGTAEKDAAADRSLRSEVREESRSADQDSDLGRGTPIYRSSPLRQLGRGDTDRASNSATAGAFGFQMPEGEQVLTLVEAEVNNKQLQELLVQVQQLPANVIQPPSENLVTESADSRGQDVQARRLNENSENASASDVNLFQSKTHRAGSSVAGLKESLEANAETWLLVDAPLETFTQALQKAEAQITLTESHQWTFESVQRDAAQRRLLRSNYQLNDAIRKAVPQQPESGERRGQEPASATATAPANPPAPALDAVEPRTDGQAAAPPAGRPAGPAPGAASLGTDEALKERLARDSNQPSQEQQSAPNHRVLLLLRLGSRGSVNSATTASPANDSAD
jgi:hypothetical protein